ncbi:hypothetical protein SpCBS45565_g03186 [Spizellomyces sp. 'palustris']|nr:hypothetical protein SpCBS45565_g03186 [Spizellomyces sp. 'palustris']
MIKLVLFITNWRFTIVKLRIRTKLILKEDSLFLIVMYNCRAVVRHLPKVCKAVLFKVNNDSHSAPTQKDAKREKELVYKEFLATLTTSSENAKQEALATENLTPKKKGKKLNPTIELMKMKMHAKGEKSVPLESRVYFRIYFPLASKIENQAMFFHKDWTIGRLIDNIAAAVKIQNRNNTGHEDKNLNLFHGDTGGYLATDATLPSLISTKHLQSGQTLILERHQGPTIPLTDYLSNE